MTEFAVRYEIENLTLNKVICDEIESDNFIKKI